MDVLSQELEHYLIAYGKNEKLVSKKMKNYTEHLLHLQNYKDEMFMADVYGLYGHTRKSIDQLAFENHTSPENIASAIEFLLRRLSVTPEWQMMRSVINHK